MDGLNTLSISSKPFWKRINTIKNIDSHSKSSKIPTLVHESKQFNTDLEKAELFGTKLANTFCDANDQKFDQSHKTKIEIDTAKANLKNFQTDNNYFTIHDLNKAIKTLNNNSSPGPDKITNLQSKNLSADFKLLILKLFNKTVSQKQLPDIWKESIITMIPKKNNFSNNPKDYRPISVTSCLGKLCEKLILDKLSDFLESNNLIIKQKSGFRKARQTKDNLAYLIQKVRESFNRKKKF